MAFSGFSQGAVDFLWGIRLHNERAWFLAHKQDYLTLVDAPLRALCAEALAAMNDEFPDLSLEGHTCRIYRDARRLHGRGPYKDTLWFTLQAPYSDNCYSPVFYFEIGPDHFGYGMGAYDGEPSMMQRFRDAIDRDPRPMTALAEAVAASRFAPYGEFYKRPKGDKGPLLNDWYNRRRVGVSFDDNPDGVLFTPDLLPALIEGYRALVPLYRYLRGVALDASHADHL